jgi:hypothetical protein
MPAPEKRKLTASIINKVAGRYNDRHMPHVKASCLRTGMCLTIDESNLENMRPVKYPLFRFECSFLSSRLSYTDSLLTSASHLKSAISCGVRSSPTSQLSSLQMASRESMSRQVARVMSLCNCWRIPQRYRAIIWSSNRHPIHCK